jgi:uncharacterized protein (TIGR04255 family)
VTRRIYPKPPIVEAIIEFHFEARAEASEIANNLLAMLGDRYGPDVVQQDLFQVTASGAGDGGVSTSARRVPHMLFLRSASGLRQIGCGNNALSVHTLAPYPGWESFMEQAREAVDALPKAVRQARVHRIAIRYLDVIRLPPGEPLGDFVTVIPNRPNGMPANLINYRHFTQTKDPADGTIVQLTVASTSAPNHDGSGLLYDLALIREGDPVSSFDQEQWVPHVESMHTRLRDIFESSITDKTRELFL